LHRARNFLKDKLEKYASSMGYGNEALDDIVDAAEPEDE
jgi:hypothetical protein